MHWPFCRKRSTQEIVEFNSSLKIDEKELILTIKIVVIGVVWKYLKRNQITIRLKMMPADRRALELQHVVAAIARQDISEFTLTAKSADDPKMQVLQKWVHATVDSLIDMTAAMDNYDFMAKGRIILSTMKVTNLFSALIFR